MPPAIIASAGRDVRGGEPDHRDAFALGQRPRGRFEDHIVAEVVPFVMQLYLGPAGSRDAYALLGISAGGYVAMAIAIKHRDIFKRRRHDCRTSQHALRITSEGNTATDFDPGMYL